MNRLELVAKIAEKHGLSKAEAARILSTITEEIVNTVKNDDPLTLVGFGTFKKQVRPARTGRNPATGETITIPEKVTLIGKHAFYLCSSLKEAYFEDETSVWYIPKFDTDPMTSRYFTPKNDEPDYNAMYLTAEFVYALDWEKQTD